jgi:hypothetical protein
VPDAADVTGWPTDAFLVVMADSPDDARLVMAGAISQRRSGALSRELRARLSEIFIEAPRELADGDPRAVDVTGDAPRFGGFET